MSMQGSIVFHLVYECVISYVGISTWEHHISGNKVYCGVCESILIVYVVDGGRRDGM